MLTGLLFGQDVLLHKSGENYKGTFIGKVDEDIVFQIEGRSSTNKFPINDVDIVITSREGIKVELYYPFDTSTKKDNQSFGQDILNLKSGESFEGTFHEKLGRDILFKAVGDTTMKKYPIWDIETIETMNWGELTYPFDIPIDIPTKKEGNELAPIAMQFLFNPTPLQNCMGSVCSIIVFIIAIALNPGSDS